MTPRQKRGTLGKPSRRASDGQMFTVLITSFLLFAAISYAIYRWQRSSSTEDAAPVLPPPPPTGGLFGEVSRREEEAFLAAELAANIQAQRTALLARAAAGDKKSLAEAADSGDSDLYTEVLDALTAQANSDQSLLSLVSYIARNGALRVNPGLATKFIENWKHAPDRSGTAKMLHVAALAGDAELYQQAIETAAQFWSGGRIPALSADELRQLVESEYWLLPAECRNSGAGFILKRTMTRIGRELAAATK